MPTFLTTTFPLVVLRGGITQDPFEGFVPTRWILAPPLNENDQMFGLVVEPSCSNQCSPFNGWASPQVVLGVRKGGKLGSLSRWYPFWALCGWFKRDISKETTSFLLVGGEQGPLKETLPRLTSTPHVCSTRCIADVGRIAESKSRILISMCQSGRKTKRGGFICGRSCFRLPAADVSPGIDRRWLPLSCWSESEARLGAEE